MGTWNWRRFFRNVACTGTAASVTTAAASAACGQAELGNPVAPVNAISHIAWGDAAAAVDGLTAQHTLVGLALNSAAMFSWAGVHELLFGKLTDRGGLGTALAGGAALAGIAYITDYHLVPKRFTPGFELRLSGGALAAIYGVMALTLGLGRYCCRGETR